jgi:hypothetical protein
MPNEYVKGEQIRCRGTFTDESGNAVDPTGVFFQAKGPDGTLEMDYEYGVDAELVRQAAGIYRVDVDGDTVGHWYTRMWSTGTGKAAEEGEFRIISSRF